MRFAYLFALTLGICLVARVCPEPRDRVRFNWPTTNLPRTPSCSTMGSPMCCGCTMPRMAAMTSCAEAFFAAAAVTPVDRRLVHGRRDRSAARQVREVHLTAPAAGSYKLKCSHSFHKIFGMSRQDRRPLGNRQSLDFPLLACRERARRVPSGMPLVRDSRCPSSRLGLNLRPRRGQEFKDGPPSRPGRALASPAPLDPSPGHLGGTEISAAPTACRMVRQGDTFRSMAWIVRKKPIWLPS